MSSQMMGVDQFLKAKIPRKEGSGPCLKALNEFARTTADTTFYDCFGIHTDQFYMKYSYGEHGEQLGRRIENAEICEYLDENMQLANQCLYRFQTLCDQNKISTRNPISFFDSLSKHMESSKYDYAVAAAVFLYAIADKDFLFDCSVVNHMPNQFITRASIEELKSTLEITNYDGTFNSLKGTKLPKTREEFDHLLDVLQEQVRSFHLLMGPSRSSFCKIWDEKVLPTVRSMQVKICQFNKIRSIDNKITSKSFKKQCFIKDLIEAVLDCFIWHVSSKRHLGTKVKEDVDKVLPYLKGKGNSELKQFISNIIEDVIQNYNFCAIPYNIYQVITNRFDC